MNQVRKYAVLFVLLALLAPLPGSALCVDCIEKCWGLWVGCLQFCGLVDAGWSNCSQYGEICTVQPATGCDVTGGPA